MINRLSCSPIHWPTTVPSIHSPSPAPIVLVNRCIKAETMLLKTFKENQGKHSRSYGLGSISSPWMTEELDFDFIIIVDERLLNPLSVRLYY